MALINPLVEVFIKVVELGSFTKAAGELYLSPTAVMKQMNQLEEDVGAKLLIRTTHGIRLTKAGESLRGDAAFMERYGEESVRRAREAQEKSRHVIRLGTSPLFPGRDLIAIWEREHPQVILESVPPRYDIDVFNECEESGSLLLTLDGWEEIHLSLVSVPFDVPFAVPYGILYEREPGENVGRFLRILERDAQKT